MNRLSTEKRVQIIGCLVEGNSIRATVRMTGAAKNTITKAKQKNVPEEFKGTYGYGDVWTFTALCVDTKLVPSAPRWGL